MHKEAGNHGVLNGKITLVVMQPDTGNKKQLGRLSTTPLEPFFSPFPLWADRATWPKEEAMYFQQGIYK